MGNHKNNIQHRYKSHELNAQRRQGAEFNASLSQIHRRLTICNQTKPIPYKYKGLLFTYLILSSYVLQSLAAQQSLTSEELIKKVCGNTSFKNGNKPNIT